MNDYNIDFKDHVVEYPNRFRQVQVAPGIVDLIPTWIEDPSQVIEEGTPVNADLFDKLRANVTRRSETFAATAAQTVFNLTQAYLVDQGRLDVYISGVKQRSGIDFTETSPTSFTLSEGLEVGTVVEAVYFSASQALSEDLIEQVQAAEAATLAANEAAQDASKATTAALTANLNWLEPVDNLSALNALSNPQTGDTRQTKDTGNVYRYDVSAWVLIQTMDPNAINALDTRLTSQLADKAQFQNQSDFVEIVKGHTKYEKVQLVKTTETKIELKAVNGNKGVSYQIIKDANDDFHKLGEGKLIGASAEVESAKAMLETGDVTGVWTQAVENWYTSEIGATFTKTIKGNNIYLGHYADTRGGVFEIIIDGNTDNPIRVSTYSPTIVSRKKTLIAEGLSNITHTIEATFVGDDPENTPSSGAGTSRGWVHGGGTSASGYQSLWAYTTDVNLLNDGSNKDMAISVSVGASAVNWIPDHGVGTVFTNNVGDIITVLVDGLPVIVSSLTVGQVIEGSTISVIQNAKVQLPDVVGDVAELKFTHSLTTDGVLTYSGKMTFLQDAYINAGYPLMLPTNGSVIDKFVTGIGSTKVSAADGSYHYFANEEDQNMNVAAISAVNKSYVAAAKVLNGVKSMRIGTTVGKPNGLETQFIWQRATPPKYYFQAYKTTNILTGDVYIWGGQFAIANIPQISDYIA